MDAGESMYPVRLRAQTLMLREFGGGDASGLYKVYGDADATRHLSFEPKDIEQVSAIVKAALTSALTDPRTEYMLAVADAHNEELVGAARLALGEYQSAQIGFALRPDVWGQGRGAVRHGRVFSRRPVTPMMGLRNHPGGVADGRASGCLWKLCLLRCLRAGLTECPRS